MKQPKVHKLMSEGADPGYLAFWLLCDTPSARAVSSTLWEKVTCKRCLGIGGKSLPAKRNKRGGRE